jgi:hypothetical protein
MADGKVVRFYKLPNEIVFAVCKKKPQREEKRGSRQGNLGKEEEM